jgi:hypothetical protein
MTEDDKNCFCRPEMAYMLWVPDGSHPVVVRKADLVRNGDRVDRVLELQPFGYPGVESRRVRDRFLVKGYPEETLELSRKREAEFLEAFPCVLRKHYTSDDLIGRVVRITTSSEHLADDEGKTRLVSRVVGYDKFTECPCNFRSNPALPDLVDSDAPRVNSANPGSRDSSAKVGDDPQTQIASSDDAEKSGG